MTSLRTPVCVLAAGALALGLSACTPPSATSTTGDSETVASAVVLAESDAGGRAFELDREDDGTWEVHVAANDRGIEVRVSAEGDRVQSRTDEDALDADDREALTAAVTTMADAVRIAVASHGGAGVEEVSIERSGDQTAWQVGFDGGDEVAVSLADGSVD